MSKPEVLIRRIEKIYTENKYPRYFREMPEEARKDIAIPKPFNIHYAEELWCEVFAAYLLVPDNWIEKDILEGKNIKELAGKYEVEESIMQFRLVLYYHDHIIDKETKNRSNQSMLEMYAD